MAQRKAANPVPAQALFAKVEHLLAAKRGPEALAASDELLARLEDGGIPGDPSLPAWALLQRGLILTDLLGRDQEGLASFELVIARYRDESDAKVREVVANAFGLKHSSLEAAGSTAAALLTIDELLAHLSHAESPRAREKVFMALGSKARLLLGEGRGAEAAIIGDALAQRIDAQWDPPELAATVRNVQRLVWEFAEAEQFEAVLAISESLMRRLQEETDLQLVQAMIQATQNATHALLRLERTEEAMKLSEWLIHFGDRAIETADEWIKSSEHASTPHERKAHAGAQLTKAGLLGALERHEEAVSLLEDLIKRYQNDATDSVEDIVMAARALREGLAEGDEE